MKRGKRLMDTTPGEIDAVGERDHYRRLARREAEEERAEREAEADTEAAWLESVAPDPPDGGPL